jgi:hypothetical protein
MAQLDRTDPRDAGDADDEPGFYALAFSTFLGPQGWVSWVLMITQTVMFGVAVWAGWRFFTATEVLPALKWGLSAATLLILATQIKLAMVPHMQANRVILAVRRLERLLAARQG